jgi:hypothetical protein
MAQEILDIQKVVTIYNTGNLRRTKGSGSLQEILDIQKVHTVYNTGNLRHTKGTHSLQHRKS